MEKLTKMYQTKDGHWEIDYTMGQAPINDLVSLFFKRWRDAYGFFVPTALAMLKERLKKPPTMETFDLVDFKTPKQERLAFEEFMLAACGRYEIEGSQSNYVILRADKGSKEYAFVFGKVRIDEDRDHRKHNPPSTLETRNQKKPRKWKKDI